MPYLNHESFPLSSRNTLCSFGWWNWGLTLYDDDHNEMLHASDECYFRKPFIRQHSWQSKRVS